MTRPLVSIVTPSYNQAEFLEETIRSVLDQGYEPLEYLVVDGGSADGSVEIVRRYEDRLASWTNAPDSGQAQALNRGFAQSRGEYLGWLCSDDTLLPGAIETMVDFLERRPDVDLVFGDALWSDRRSRQTGYAASREWDANEILRGGSLPLYQPSSLWRRRLWEVAGPFEEDLHYLFDTAFFLRIAALGRPPGCPSGSRPIASTSDRSRAGPMRRRSPSTGASPVGRVAASPFSSLTVTPGTVAPPSSAARPGCWRKPEGVALRRGSSPVRLQFPRVCRDARR